MTFENLTNEVLAELAANLIFFAFHLICVYVQTKLKESDSFQRKP